MILLHISTYYLYMSGIPMILCNIMLISTIIIIYWCDINRYTEVMCRYLFMIAIGQSVAMIRVGTQLFDMDINVTKTMYMSVLF